MRLVLIGAPGSGKGTQGQRLAESSGARHIATGDLLRAQVQAKTDLGREVAAHLDAGTLVPDRVLLELVMPLARDAVGQQGYILDGFPRSVAQAEAFDALGGTDLAVQSVLYLEVPREQLVSRLLGRAAEQGRSDDTEEVIRRRLQVFDTDTSPLIEYYRRSGLLVVIDASPAVEQVNGQIDDVLDDVLG
jgi:adenylate kinase